MVILYLVLRIRGTRKYHYITGNTNELGESEGYKSLSLRFSKTKRTQFIIDGILLAIV